MLEAKSNFPPAGQGGRKIKMDKFEFLHKWAQINSYLPYQQFSQVFEGGEGMEAMKPIRGAK